MSPLGRAARLAGGFAAVCLGLLGAVFGSPAVATGAVIVAFLAGFGGYATAQRRGQRTAPLVVRYAVTGAAAVLVLGGAAFLVGPVAVPLAAGVVAAAAWRGRAGWHARAAAQAGDRAEPDEDLTTLTNAQLGREWRRSHSWLLRARTADELALVCRLRRRQLDEIERRDPSGFRRWLDGGSWVRGDSAPFLGG